jgi:hypothetical protein
MRRIIPSLIWFSALAGGSGYAAKATAAADVPYDSCAVLPATEAGATGNNVVYLNRKYGCWPANGAEPTQHVMVRKKLALCS